jgi:exodeoxyribonuclease VII large subunit
VTGSIELDRDGRTLLIRFPYNPLVVEEVKRLPRRRWDPAIKAWKVPASDVQEAVDMFLRHGFLLAPEVTGLLAGTVQPKSKAAPRSQDAGPAVVETGPGAAPALTISALNERVRQALHGAFQEPVWVVGEILDFDKNKDRKHAHFTLAEKRADADTIAARISAVLFERERQALLEKLAKVEGFTLRDGIEIRALARVDFYRDQGRCQLVIEDIDASFTLGKLALTREAILAELRRLGLERRNALLPLPVPPLRVAVLASLESDGWNDFTKELQASGFGFQVTAYAVKVQGKELRPTMLAGLAWFARHSPQFDVLCVIRGGGSRTDLAWFDDKDVAFAVARHPLKVLCGIGHERDQSVLDLITHSEKTPTAVGALLVRAVQQAAAVLADGERALGERARARIGAARATLMQQAASGRRAVQIRIAAEWQALRLLPRRLAQAVHHSFARRRATLHHEATRCRLLDPQAVVRRGYSIVRDANDRIVTECRRLAPGARFQVELRDGRVHALAERIETKNQPESKEAD